MSKYTYSEIIYLNGARFAHGKKMLSLTETLPDESQVDTKDLCHQVIEGAFYYLYDNKYIDLTLDTKNSLVIFKKKVVSVKKLKESDNGVTGLEENIMSKIKDNSDVQSVVYNLLDSECFDPWGEIVRYSKNSLVVKKVLNTVEVKKFLFKSFEYKYDENMQNEGKDDYEAVKDKLTHFSRESFYDTLHKGVLSGVSARQEQSEIDSD